jgi:hypothetical protein
MCWLSELAKIYADSGRPSIPPERLLRALLLQAFYNVAAPCKPLAWCSGKKVLEGYAHKPLHSLNLRVMKPC